MAGRRRVLTLSIVVSVVLVTASAFYVQSRLFSRSDTSFRSIPNPRHHPSSAMSLWTINRSALDPEQLVKGSPQMAKDLDYANAVISAWSEDEATMIAHGTRSADSSETRLIEYQDSNNGTTLYGHLIRRHKTSHDKKIPGVLLFHTGAGPHDISLLWKADLLATNQKIFPDGCVVLVTDILSDDTGWAWGSDRTKYNEARTKVLDAKTKSGERHVLQSRIRAALKGLQEAAPEVDMTRLCALGWCLGGHSILELGRMMIPGMKAMITFHGVFDGASPAASEQNVVSSKANGLADILICNGQLDPFVSQPVLHNAIDTLKTHGHNVRLLQLEGAKHGFSNPAQDFNPNEAFAYNRDAAHESWTEALKLLQAQLLPANTNSL